MKLASKILSKLDSSEVNADLLCFLKANYRPYLVDMLFNRSTDDKLYIYRALLTGEFASGTNTPHPNSKLELTTPKLEKSQKLALPSVKTTSRAILASQPLQLYNQGFYWEHTDGKIYLTRLTIDRKTDGSVQRIEPHVVAVSNEPVECLAKIDNPYDEPNPLRGQVPHFVDGKWYFCHSYRFVEYPGYLSPVEVDFSDVDLKATALPVRGVGKLEVRNYYRRAAADNEPHSYQPPAYHVDFQDFLDHLRSLGIEPLFANINEDLLKVLRCEFK